MIDEELLARVRRDVAGRVEPESLLRVYGDPSQRRLLRERVRSAAGPGLDDEVIDEVCAELFGLGPLQRFVDDPAVTDVLVNAPDEIYVERHGRLERAAASFRDRQTLADLVYRIAASVGRELTIERPYVDARLRDGSRANAVIEPVGGPTLSIRTFRRLAIGLGGDPPSWEAEGLPAGAIALLSACVRARANIVVAGATGSGKSTLLRSLAAEIPVDERLVVIEDTSELVLPHPHTVHLECVPGREGERVRVADLVVNALRMRPDRILVGEIRTPREASAYLEALSTGHEGSLTTIHAGSAADAVWRLELLLARSGELPSAALRGHVLRAVDVIVHVARLRTGRRSVREIAACDDDGVRVLWRAGQAGPAEPAGRLRSRLL